MFCPFKQNDRRHCPPQWHKVGQGLEVAFPLPFTEIDGVNFTVVIAGS